MDKETFQIPWPAKIVVILTESDGVRSAYGLFDTEAEAEEWVERCVDAGEISPSTEADIGLLWAK